MSQRGKQTNSGMDMIRVGVLEDDAATREILAGVRRYVAEHGPWSTFIELRALDSAPPPWLRQWDGDGILSRTFTPETALPDMSSAVTS